MASLIGSRSRIDAAVEACKCDADYEKEMQDLKKKVDDLQNQINNLKKKVGL
jgi:peptidoglycan hydrolase CwlO-like protein